MGVMLGIGVILGRGVILGKGVMVGSGVIVGIGVGVPMSPGPRIGTASGVPVLKNPIVASVLTGGVVESNRKLYSVPKRMALAFWSCAKVSQFHVAETRSLVKVHGTLLYPASPCVPSCGNPGC